MTIMRDGMAGRGYGVGGVEVVGGCLSEDSLGLV